MNRKEFVELFKSRLSEGMSRHSLVTPILLERSLLHDDITSENQLQTKGQFAIKLIIAGVDISDSLAALKAFDDIVQEFIALEQKNKYKIKNGR